MCNAETALKEMEDSLSAHQDAARIQQEEAQRSIAGKFSRFCCCFDSNLSQLILVPLIRAEAESGGRSCGEGGCQHRAHGGAG